jgi:hypothetical protein
MPRKRILVDVDENQWAALKGQAGVEGRFVRVVLAEAIAGWLARRRGDHALVPSSPLSPLNVPPKPEQTWADKIGAKPKDRAFVSAVAERQAWLRDHPEDEQQ